MSRSSYLLRQSEHREEEGQMLFSLAEIYNNYLIRITYVLVATFESRHSLEVFHYVRLLLNTLKTLVIGGKH